MNKQRLILLGCFMILVGVPLLIWIVGSNTPPQQPQPTPIVEPSVAPYVRTPQGKIIIDTIEMNDFTKNPEQVNTLQDVLFIERDNFSIAYLKTFDKFVITITQTPFESNRIQAEEELLRTLGITEGQACELTVEIGMPEYIDPEFTGMIFPLSFCE